MKLLKNMLTGKNQVHKSMKNTISDTNPDVEKFYIEKLKTLSASKKLKMVGDMTSTCRKMALIGLRHRYPQATEDELRLRLDALWLDNDIMLKVYSWNVEEMGL